MFIYRQNNVGAFAGNHQYIGEAFILMPQIITAASGAFVAVAAGVVSAIVEPIVGTIVSRAVNG